MRRKGRWISQRPIRSAGNEPHREEQQHAHRPVEHVRHGHPASRVVIMPNNTAAKAEKVVTKIKYAARGAIAAWRTRLHVRPGNNQKNDPGERAPTVTAHFISPRLFVAYAAKKSSNATRYTDP